MTLKDQIEHLKEFAKDNGVAAKAQWKNGNANMANYHEGKQAAFDLCAGWLEKFVLPHIVQK